MCRLMGSKKVFYISVNFKQIQMLTMSKFCYHICINYKTLWAFRFILTLFCTSLVSDSYIMVHVLYFQPILNNDTITGSHSLSSRLIKSCRSSRSPVRRFWDRSIMCAREPMWWPMASRSRPLSLSLTDCRVSRICWEKRECDLLSPHLL